MGVPDGWSPPSVELVETSGTESGLQADSFAPCGKFSQCLDNPDADAAISSITIDQLRTLNFMEATLVVEPPS